MNDIDDDDNGDIRGDGNNCDVSKLQQHAFFKLDFRNNKLTCFCAYNDCWFYYNELTSFHLYYT